MTEPLRVLVVEDDEWAAEQFVRTLTHAGFEASRVADGLAAIDEMDKQRPDVLVLDVFLTGPNAFVLMHEMRSYPDLASVPIVLCTNSAAEIAHINLSPYGVSGVLDKTKMTPAMLVSAVKKAVLWREV